MRMIPESGPRFPSLRIWQPYAHSCRTGAQRVTDARAGWRFPWRLVLRCECFGVPQAGDSEIHFFSISYRWSSRGPGFPRPSHSAHVLLRQVRHRARRHPMRIEAITTVAQFDALQDHWRQLEVACPTTSIFLTWEWQPKFDISRPKAAVFEGCGLCGSRICTRFR